MAQAIRGFYATEDFDLAIPGPARRSCSDAIGLVEAVGPDATDFRVGDRVGSRQTLT